MDLPAAVLEPGRALAFRLVVALAILLTGWLAAKITKGLVFRFLLTIRFDIASERAGMAAPVGAASALGLSQVSEVLTGGQDYAPKAIAAVVVLVLGLFLASFLAGSPTKRRRSTYG